MNPPWLSEIDHTGDAGIAVSAPDLPTLFERAAWAMFAVLTDPETVEPAEQRSLEIDATDLNDLLVRWLSDLNFMHVTERMLFSTFAVAGLSERHLSATVGGEPVDASRHVVHTEIKAVTYHALAVEKRSDGWHAQVIFDL